MPATSPNTPGLLEFLLQYVTDERKALIKEIAAMRTRHFTVVLEDVFHSHNAAAVLRSCDCFGVQDVHIIENRYDWNHHPQIEIGSAKWLSIHRHRQLEHNTEACLQQLKEKGYQIVATSPHATLSIDEVAVETPSAFVFGAERKGVTAQVYAMADLTCKIPMYGFTESFNISVAAALTLHAMRRRLNESKVAWQLREDELQELYLQWAKNSLKQPEKYIRAWQERQ